MGYWRRWLFFSSLMYLLILPFFGSYIISKYFVAKRKREINHPLPETPKNPYIWWQFVNRHTWETLKKKAHFLDQFLAVQKMTFFDGRISGSTVVNLFVKAVLLWLFRWGVIYLPFPCTRNFSKRPGNMGLNPLLWIFAIRKRGINHPPPESSKNPHIGWPFVNQYTWEMP